MGAYTGAQAFFDKPLECVARMLGYAEDNILVLTGNAEALEKEFPATYENIRSCVHHADKRTPIAYAQDLVASWLIEDSFLVALKCNGLDVTLDGADRGRKILSGSKTSASSDFLVRYNGNARNMELMNDYTGFWEKSGKLHLRDNKYLKLQQNKSLFLAVAMPTRRFVLYDFVEEIHAVYIQSHHAYGNKPVYELSISSEMMQCASSRLIVEEIKRHLL